MQAMGQLVNSQQQLTNALGLLENNNQPVPNNNNNNPKISIKIPTCKGEARENVVAWLLQVQTIFDAQNITGDQIQINYTTTGLESIVLHQFLNKVTAAKVGNVSFVNWNIFITKLKQAF